MHKVRTESLKLISDFTNQTLSGWLAVKAKDLNTYHFLNRVGEERFKKNIDQDSTWIEAQYQH